MLRVKNEHKAKTELKKILRNFQSQVDEKTFSYQQYYKIPELWVCDFVVPLNQTTHAETIFTILLDAYSIANSWSIIGGALDQEEIGNFEGIYNKESCHSPISCFEWGHFQFLQ